LPGMDKCPPEIFLLGGDSLRKANKNPDPPAE
jgi:hypothetical protein